MSNIIGEVMPEELEPSDRERQRWEAEDRAAETLGVTIRHGKQEGYEHLESIRMGKRGEIHILRRIGKTARSTPGELRLEWFGDPFGPAIVINLTERATLSLHEAFDQQVRRVRRRRYSKIMDENGRLLEGKP